MARRAKRITVALDDEQAERLTRMAEQLHASEGALAGSLLSRAIDEAEVDRKMIVEVLNGIPGAQDRNRLARQQMARGEGMPLDEL
jgi:hypothetical protein